MISSPLRYPGGKKKVLKMIKPFFTDHKEYREPFVGGGSVFLGKKLAEKNWLNDADRGVSDLWSCISNQESNEKLRKMIMEYTPPTIEMWVRWKNMQPGTVLESAFRTLFLNRTCYSGLLNGNPIGGINQTGPLTVDVRWNAKALCRQIEACYYKISNTRVTCSDFEESITASGQSVFIYLDPPYFKKGNLLYSVKMTLDDHYRLAKILNVTKHRFLLTYDDCPEIRALYDGAYFHEKKWFYSMNDKVERKQGNELFISNFKVSQILQLELPVNY